MAPPLRRGWNKPAEVLQEPVPAPPSKRRIAGGLLSLLTLAGALLLLQSHSVVILGDSPLLPFIQPAAGWAGYGVAAICLVIGANSVRELRSRRKVPAWQKELNEGQRQLLGLPATPSKVQEAGSQPADAASPGARPSPSFGPPLRPPRVPPLPPASGLAAGGEHQTPGGASYRTASFSGASPSSLGPGRVPGTGPVASPYSGGKAVTTPRQLQRFMDEFEKDIGSQESPEADYGGYSTPRYGYSTGLGGSGAAAPPQLPMGPNAPTYRPSLQARGTTGSPSRGDGRPTQSGLEEYNALLARFKIDRATLDEWTERFRFWLASDVLQPLARALKSAHSDVRSSVQALQLGWEIRLAPLDGEHARGQHSRGAPPEADEEMLGQLRQQLQQLRSQAGANPTAARALDACLAAVQRYSRLAALVRGEAPSSLLPPTPQSYLAARIRALAEGPCMQAFAWNSGGEWNGKPWTPELPTDSALQFFVLAAYLQAPRWEFPLNDTHHAASSSGPLYTGSLPSRPAEHYFALLPMRPPAAHKGCSAVVGIGLATREPHFMLVLKGAASLTLSSPHALFHTSLLLMASAAPEWGGGGALGSSTLAYLGLDKVLQPRTPNYNVLLGRWFGLW